MDMHMPSPGPQHEVLAKLAGHWAGPETMMPSPWSPEQQERHGVLRARMLEGFFLVSDYEQFDADGSLCFRGHGVYSWDPDAEEFVMYWFDSVGGPGGVSRGRFEGNQLTFEKTSPLGHHRYRYTFGHEETVFEMELSQDGLEWSALMEGRYRPV